MRGAVRIAALACVILFTTVQPADAIWRWLERMSGPGWYNGVSLEWKMKCEYPTDLSPIEAEALKTIARPHSRRTLEAFLEREKQTFDRTGVKKAIEEKLKGPFEPLMGGAVISLPCGLDEKVGDTMRPRTAALGISTGLLWSTNNPLRYDPSVDPGDTQVWIPTLGVFYDRRIPWDALNRVEVGGSVEGYLFLGKTTRTMARIALEPRATVTLGTIRDEHTGAPAFSVKARVGVVWVLPGFTAEDFGALPSAERLGGGEPLASVRLIVDFECLPWKVGSCAGTK